LIAVTVYLVLQNVRNAPLALGSGATAIAATTEASSAEIPVGVPSREIAFMGRAEGGTWDIWRMSADGTLQNLTSGTDNDAAHDYFPSWSLDGAQINFLSNRMDAAALGPSQINADGTGLRNLDILSAVMTMVMTQRFDWDPAYSPDGTRLLWSSVRDTNLENYMIALDQPFQIENATRLTNSPARDWFATWSPDGVWISRNSDVNGKEDVFIQNTRTGETRQLSNSPFDDLRANWALDGSQLLYVQDTDDTALAQGELQLYLVLPDGSDNTLLGERIFSGGAAWSVDGLVAYSSNESGRWQIYVMNADGSNLRRITPPAGDYLYPVWRP
jgi:TolB protein